jgi:hypothetical protein
MGYLGLLRPDGAYEALEPLVLASTHLGWNFNPIFALELGYQAGIFKNPNGALGAVKQPTLSSVTLDLRFRFVRPRRYTRVIPYLQTGVGLYLLQARRQGIDECDEDAEKRLDMAYGGGLQVGGGLDIYLAPWMVLGAKVLYRPLFMSAMRCGPGGAACAVAPDDPLRKLHGLSAELTLAITFPH